MKTVTGLEEEEDRASAQTAVRDGLDLQQPPEGRGPAESNGDLEFRGRNACCVWAVGEHCRDSSLDCGMGGGGPSQ